MTSVFDYSDYKDFLKAALATTGETRGKRTQLADYVGCQVAFISQVLSGAAHLSLEYAFQATQFLEMRPEEVDFFMLLVHSGRAGSNELKRYYSLQINQIKERRQKIAERIVVKSTLNLEAQTIYYSSWIYAAVHILLSIPEFQNPNRISEHLRLPLILVNEVIEFLVSVGLAEKKKDRYIIGTMRIHLPATSPLIAKHHINWRMQAIQSLERRDPRNLHYSLVMSLAKKDVEKIKNLILSTVESAEKIFKPSDEETTQCLSLDLFSF